MIFTDFPFLVFAIIFFPLYFVTRGQLRITLMLVASYIFYSWWDWRFLSLLILTTLVDYCAALKIADSRSPSRRHSYLMISVVANLTVLGFFKYFNFFIDSAAVVLDSIGLHYSMPVLDIVLPIGISFYTFQSMSYTIDVYRRESRAERSLLVFATCVAIFPHLVAGPIIRASTLIPQVRAHHDWSWPRVLRGLECVVWGFFLKLVLADNLAPLVDGRFAHPDTYGGGQLALGAVGFAFQIYGDFAGYSLIAIGLGRIMGLNFGKNFNRPYFATDFSDFWRRWHISLSSWLRDYLYISLGGNRNGAWATRCNLMLTMLLGGLWHGANWTFVVWGFLHGMFLILQRTVATIVPLQLPATMDMMMRGLRMALVFACVCLAWVFFRAPDLQQALHYLYRIGDLRDFWVRPAESSLVKAYGFIAFVVAIDALTANQEIRKTYLRSPLLRALGAAFLIWSIILFGRFDAQAFIYFQF
ncbi:MAG: MBOAT family O-acyltransferase [Ferrovibrio sp.]